MQYKKSLLQRLLVIYITFFIVLVMSFVHEGLPDFTKGYSDGVEVSNDITEKWMSGTPRLFYLLQNIPIANAPTTEIPETDSTTARTVKARITNLTLTVEENAPEDMSMLGVGFYSYGGSPWVYSMILLLALFYLAIIVLMIMIIHSLRRSIREERTLDRRNVWLLRAIGMLTILNELLGSTAEWMMSNRAAGLLSQSGYTVDTGFHVSYSIIIMGILILFAAEVFAIGQNLSEEQKLTI